MAYNSAIPPRGTPLGSPEELASVVSAIGAQASNALAPDFAGMAGSVSTFGTHFYAPVLPDLRMFEIVEDWLDTKPDIAGFPGPTLGINWWAYAKEVVYWFSYATPTSPEDSYWKAAPDQTGKWDEDAGIGGSLTPIWCPVAGPDVCAGSGKPALPAIGDWCWCIYDHAAAVWKIISGGGGGTGNVFRRFKLRENLVAGGSAKAELATLGATGILKCAATVGDELLTNGGFESDFASWDQTADDGAIATTTVAGEFHTGTAAKLTSGPNIDTKISQTVTVVPGTLYRLTMWVRGDTHFSGQWSLYDVTNSADIQGKTSTSNYSVVYKRIISEFKAPVDCVSLRLDLWAPAVDGYITYFDDVSIVSAEHAVYFRVFDPLSEFYGTMDVACGIAYRQSDTPTLVGDELLVNPGFEGGLASWDQTAGDGAIATTTVAGEFHAGTAAKLTEGVTVDGIPPVPTKISQTIPVIADTLYRLTIWTRGDGTSAGEYGIYDVTNSLDIRRNTATGNISIIYGKICRTFTTPVGCVSIRLDLWAPATDGGIAYFDDISIVQLTPLWEILRITCDDFTGCCQGGYY